MKARFHTSNATERPLPISMERHSSTTLTALAETPILCICIFRSHNGGFHNANYKTTSLFHTFASSLRANSTSASCKSRNLYPNSNSSSKLLGISFASRTKEKIQAMSFYQQSSISRLSKPKWRRNKLL
jgi:hypothetical protein